MEGLRIIEDKFLSLVDMLRTFKKENRQLQSENEALKFEIAELATENARLHEKGAQLVAEFESARKAVIEESEELLVLEKERAKEVVDDLIRNIEQLVEKEINYEC